MYVRTYIPTAFISQLFHTITEEVPASCARTLLTSLSPLSHPRHHPCLHYLVKMAEILMGPMVRGLDEVSYSRDATVAAMRDYYRFLAAMYVNESLIF